MQVLNKINLRHLSPVKDFDIESNSEWIALHMSNFDVAIVKELILVVQYVLTQIWSNLDRKRWKLVHIA